jgi:hypothetical protein
MTTATGVSFDVKSSPNAFTDAHAATPPTRRKGDAVAENRATLARTHGDAIFAG